MSRNLKTYLGILIILILPVLLLTGCGGQNGANSNTGPIKIGWLGALSGTNAILGKWDTDGTQLAFDAVNAAGGINGRQLELIKYDDKGDPATSMDYAKKLINEDHVVFAFATVLSTPTLADEPIFTQARVGQMTTGMAVGITAQGSSYIFRKADSSPAVEDTFIDYLVQQKGFKTFAQIADTTDYGKGNVKAEQAELQKFGITPVTTQSYSPDDKDFTGQLETIIRLKPQVLILGGSEVASGLIAKQARQLGFTGQIAGGTAIGTPQFISTAGPDVANGVIFASAYISNDATAQTKAFAKAFEAKFGYAPDVHCAEAYDGAELLIQAIKASGTNVTGPEIAKQLHAIHGYQGLLGTLDVQPNGEMLKHAQMGIIKDGQLTPMAQ